VVFSMSISACPGWIMQVAPDKRLRREQET
jgi:hypothetical protein